MKEIPQYIPSGPAPKLMPFQWEPFNGDHHLTHWFAHLSLKGIDTCIELGTCLGSSTIAMQILFKQVYSIEINQEFLGIAQHRLVGLEKQHGPTNRCELYLGSTLDVLPYLLPRVRERRCVFFVDSHWEKHVPLLQELELIAEADMNAPVLIIHDFFNPHRPDFGYDTYNGQRFDIDWIGKHLDKIYGKDNYNQAYNFEAEGAKRGAVMILPRYQVHLLDGL